MQKVIISIFTIICFCLITLNAMAYPVKLISNNSHVWGDYYIEYGVGVDDNWQFMPPLQDSYDSMGNASQSGSVSCSTLHAFSSANLFDISIDAYGHLWDFPFGDLVGAYPRANAQTDTIFRPLYNFNTLNFKDAGWSDYGYNFSGSLIDLTDNIVIWNASYQAIDPYGPVAINHAFQSDHLYSAHLYATGTANWGDSLNLSFGFTDLKAVPEPSTMFLLGLGLMGLAGLRRKLKLNNL
ncbi:MAG: PEP-CTERM motif protein [Deltaproteobacteria bacterium ADurb.Bin151]|nr:MAG: PEP-CTERM motif protein [Deltaproteobacteria bacterium ADurb.Bin151]